MEDPAHHESLPTWTLGDRLRKARLHASIGSSGVMAKRLGVHRNSVINYETDRITPPLDAVVRYSKITGVPLDWFLEDYDPGEAEDAVTMRYPGDQLAPVIHLFRPQLAERELAMVA
jgi:transcriptional regulator with XRE-family HTH domain